MCFPSPVIALSQVNHSIHSILFRSPSIASTSVLPRSDVKVVTASHSPAPSYGRYNQWETIRDFPFDSKLWNSLISLKKVSFPFVQVATATGFSGCQPGNAFTSQQSISVIKISVLGRKFWEGRRWDFMGVGWNKEGKEGCHTYRGTSKPNLSSVTFVYSNVSLTARF